MKTKGKGSLPKDCPNCKSKEVEWDYQDIQIEANETYQEIFCPDCDSKFIEFYTLSGWEKIK